MIVCVDEVNKTQARQAVPRTGKARPDMPPEGDSRTPRRAQGVVRVPRKKKKAHFNRTFYLHENTTSCISLASVFFTRKCLTRKRFNDTL